MNDPSIDIPTLARPDTSARLRVLASWLDQIGSSPMRDLALQAARELDGFRQHVVGTGLFSIGTWDGEQQAYTPQGGCRTPWLNVDRRGLRAHLKELRRMGYSAHRKRDQDGEHEDNDTSVLVERTDGMLAEDILASWER